MRPEASGKRGVPTDRRNKPERPRDRLGRPMAWDAVGELEMEDFDRLPVEENHRLARAHVAAGRYFPAHEAWETAWKQSKGTGDEELFKGLSQMGAGYVHLQRGNVHGAVTLLGRAARRIGAYPSGHRGVATLALRDRLIADISRIERGALVPGEDSAFQPPTV